MNWLFTSAFCKAKMLKDGLEHIYSSPQNVVGFKHVVIDQHYPVDKENNREQIKKLCQEFGCIYIDSLYDRGLHMGINNAMNIVGVTPNDVFIGCDPDDRPSDGMFQAMRKVMIEDPMVAVCACNFWVLPWKQKDQGLLMQETKIAGERVWIHPGVEMWNIAAFNLGLVNRIGGFHQPNAFYGGIEIALYQQWVQHGMKLVYLIDYTSEAVKVDREDGSLYDKTYGEWKIAHAHKGFKGSFADWLNEKR